MKKRNGNKLLSIILVSVIQIMILIDFCIALKAVFASTSSNDEYFNNQWAIQKVELDKAWDVCTGSDDVTIGIVDSGVFGAHYDLSSNINVSLSTTLNPNLSSGLDDVFGHGTRVTGIIGAKGNNSIGIAGACWDCNLASIRVANDSGMDVSGEALSDSIEYAINNNISLLNISITDFDYNPDMANDILSYNGILVCAAGNFGSNIDYYTPFIGYPYPACYLGNSVITVGNSNSLDEKATDSNFGLMNVDLFAPGVDIVSCTNNNDYGNGSGTSFAAPLVTGTIALLKSINPSLTKTQLRSAILNNVDQIESLSDKCASGGRLNSFKSVLSVVPEILTTPQNIQLDPSFTRYVRLNCTPGHYTLCFNNAPADFKVSLYKRVVDGDLVVQEYHDAGTSKYLSFVSNFSGNLYIKLDNLGTISETTSVNYTVNNNHDYSYRYLAFNQFSHKAFCECGSGITSPHIFQTLGPGYPYTCIYCGYVDNNRSSFSEIEFENVDCVFFANKTGLLKSQNEVDEQNVNGGLVLCLE